MFEPVIDKIYNANMAPIEHSELTGITDHFQTLWVDVMDATFSTSSGAVQPYGQAMDCQCSGDKRASAMVDLQGTGFAVDTQKVDLEELLLFALKHNRRGSKWNASNHLCIVFGYSIKFSVWVEPNVTQVIILQDVWLDIKYIIHALWFVNVTSICAMDRLALFPPSFQTSWEVSGRRGMIAEKKWGPQTLYLCCGGCCGGCRIKGRALYLRRGGTWLSHLSLFRW